MLQSNWNSRDHALYRAQAEIRKAVAAPQQWLRAHHLAAAIAWIERGKALCEPGLWDRLAEPLVVEGRAAANDRSA